MRGLTQVSTVRALAQLAQVLDDSISANLINTVMLPLLRYEYRPMLAEALLYSASIALRQGLHRTAVHRAKSAVQHLEETECPRALEHARAFLRDCESLETD